jgi:DNA-binding protein Fis
MIDIQDLPEYLRSHSQNVALPGSVEAVDDLTLETHEKRLLVEALAQANGNQSEAARSLRIGRDALRYKMKKHNLDSPGAPKAASA